MSPDAITQLIIQYKYWILIPLSFIEGPIVAFVAGTLIAAKVFNVYLVALILFLRDMILDGFWYAFGYFGGRTSFAERMLAKIGITSNHLGQVRAFWLRRPFWTLFLGKLSYGIAAAFIVVAGVIRMPARIFFTYGALVAVVQYALLLGVGYALGASFGGDISRIIDQIEYVLLISGVVIVGYYAASWRARREFLEEEQKIEGDKTGG